MKKLFWVPLAVLAAFSFFACDQDTGDVGINTKALDQAIVKADDARYGVMVEDKAEDAPKGRYFVTQTEWDALDIAYKAAVETKVDPLSQQEINKAAADLEKAIPVFIAAKKEGTGAAITLSGTITVKNNGQLVPYVTIFAYTGNFEWSDMVRVNLAAENTPWELIMKPFSSPTEIFFRLNGFDNDNYQDDFMFVNLAEPKLQVHDRDVKDISLVLETNLITLSGTLNLDYGTTIPLVSIAAVVEYGGTIGVADIKNAGNGASWSMMIPAQDAETAIHFDILGFDGPVAWAYEMLFGFWDKDFGVKAGNQNKTGIALNLISVSGTLNVTYEGKPVPKVEIMIQKPDLDGAGEFVAWGEWITGKEFSSPSANTPWSLVLPAYASDTVIYINVNYKDVNGIEFFWERKEITVKDANVSGIKFDLGNIEI